MSSSTDPPTDKVQATPDPTSQPSPAYLSYGGQARHSSIRRIARREHTRGYLAFAHGVKYAAMMRLAIAIYLLPVFLPTVQKDLGGLTQEQLGRLGGVVFAGLVVGILITGPIADRLGAKSSAVAGN